MSEYLNQIGGNLEYTADWRRRKAEEFPEDTRNVEAAEELERLAAEIGAMPDDWKSSGKSEMRWTASTTTSSKKNMIVGSISMKLFPMSFAHRIYTSYGAQGFSNGIAIF